MLYYLLQVRSGMNELKFKDCDALYILEQSDKTINTRMKEHKYIIDAKRKLVNIYKRET